MHIRLIKTFICSEMEYIYKNSPCMKRFQLKYDGEPEEALWTMIGL